MMLNFKFQVVNYSIITVKDSQNIFFNMSWLEMKWKKWETVLDDYQLLWSSPKRSSLNNKIDTQILQLKLQNVIKRIINFWKF